MQKLTVRMKAASFTPPPPIPPSLTLFTLRPFFSCMSLKKNPFYKIAHASGQCVHNGAYMHIKYSAYERVFEMASLQTRQKALVYVLFNVCVVQCTHASESVR